jgi:hypothetical protein
MSTLLDTKLWINISGEAYLRERGEIQILRSRESTLTNYPVRRAFE